MAKERILTNVEPKEVLKYFEDLTFIPRGSGNEQEVSDYLVDFAKEHGYEWERDSYNNVIIRKPAFKGYEDHPSIVIQAHMDMVCEKNADVEHDFETEPIEFEIEGDKIIARKTSLGADDGIGIALGLAILADKTLKHPAIEFAATTDEEVNMTGIEYFNFDAIKSSRIINLDGDDEGIIVVGSAGGPTIDVDIEISREDAPKGNKAFKVAVKGLRGGHSGEDVHRGRANAIKLITRVAVEAVTKIGARVADVHGGLKYNAIPRDAYFSLSVPEEKVKEFGELVSSYREIFKDEYRVNDPDIKLVCEEIDSDTVLSADSENKILRYLMFSDDGIIRMDMDYPELVETSAGLALIFLDDETAKIGVMTRSSKVSQYEMLTARIYALAKSVGAKCTVLNDCPAWEFNPDSEMKRIFEKVYRDLYGKEASFMVLHAGLETAVFEKNMDRKLDMVSLGPDVRNLHAPGEYMTISTIQKVWETMKSFLAAL